MQTLKVQVNFSENTSAGLYQDALYYDYGTFPQLQQADIEAAKQERINDWLATVNAPPVPVTLDDVETMIGNSITDTISSLADMQDKVMALLAILGTFPDAPDWVYTTINSFQSVLNQSTDQLNSVQQSQPQPLPPTPPPNT